MKRYVKVYREQGEEGFFQPRARQRSETRLTSQIRQQAQELLEADENVAEVGRRLNVLPTTLHKAIMRFQLLRHRSERLVVKKTVTAATGQSTTKSERNEEDKHAPMGTATTRSLERVAASMGHQGSAPVLFEAAVDIPGGGVLLALPALLAASRQPGIENAPIHALVLAFQKILVFAGELV